MSRVRSYFIVLVVATGVAAAQHPGASTDALGAHLNSVRGCPACHAPHSGNQRGESTARQSAPQEMLWGNDALSTYPREEIKSVQAALAGSPEASGVLVCMSCHDGNYAPKAMMKNSIYEIVPAEVYGAPESVPTLFDKRDVNLTKDISEHPIGVDTRVKCGGAANWDCSDRDGVLRMEGQRSSRFAANYGFFIKPHSYGNASVVVCTSCHNPHSMNATKVTKSTASTIFPEGVYSTRNFLRAPYGPTILSRVSNQSAQFCRQCHAEMSNELNGSKVGTVQ